MAIHGVSKKPIPFIPEEERTVTEDQSVFWITPKTGHQANETMSRYAAARRDGRKGYADLNVRKLDNADVEEFLTIVNKVENYHFSDNFPELAKQGLMKEITDTETLKRVSMDMSADLLVELMEAANNMSLLKAGEKKSSSSRSTSASGKPKEEKE